jgi:hypothetical protein
MFITSKNVKIVSYLLIFNKFYRSFLTDANNLTIPLVKITMLIELIGIKMAATTGDNTP